MTRIIDQTVDLTNYQTKIDENHKLPISLVDIPVFTFSSQEFTTLMSGNSLSLSLSDDRISALDSDIVKFNSVGISWSLVAGKTVNNNGFMAFIENDYSPTQDLQMTYFITFFKDSSACAVNLIKTNIHNGAEANKINSISINGTTQSITNKNVDLPAYPTRSSLNINNVDNTSDLNKPVSNATQIALDGKEDKSNKVTSLSNASTDTQYPSAKVVYDNLTNVREVAEGKCKSIVISYNLTLASIYSSIAGSHGGITAELADGTDITDNILNHDYSESDIINSIFNSQSDSLTIRHGVLNTGYIVVENTPSIMSGKFIFYSTANLSDYLKTGDIILVIETDVPDRWISTDLAPYVYCYKLETTKVDLTPITNISYDSGATTISNVLNVETLVAHNTSTGEYTGLFAGNVYLSNDNSPNSVTVGANGMTVTYLDSNTHTAVEIGNNQIYYTNGNDTYYFSFPQQNGTFALTGDFSNYYSKNETYSNTEVDTLVNARISYEKVANKTAFVNGFVDNSNNAGLTLGDGNNKKWLFKWFNAGAGDLCIQNEDANGNWHTPLILNPTGPIYAFESTSYVNAQMLYRPLVFHQTNTWNSSNIRFDVDISQNFVANIEIECSHLTKTASRGFVVEWLNNAQGPIWNNNGFWVPEGTWLQNNGTSMTQNTTDLMGTTSDTYWSDTSTVVKHNLTIEYIANTKQLTIWDIMTDMTTGISAYKGITGTYPNNNTLGIHLGSTADGDFVIKANKIELNRGTIVWKNF